MRKLLVCVAVTSLAACSSTKPQSVAQVPVPVAVQTQAQDNASAIPDWFTNLPKSQDYVYSVGDGVSGSLSGALGNARANAFEGICQASGGTVRSQTKIFRQDTESNSTSISTTAIRNLCADVSVAGASVEKSKVIMENGRYHAFVLVALPLGDKNKVTQQQRERTQEGAVKSNSEREFKELDDLTSKSKQTSQVTSGQTEGLTLLDVDNEEYKKKRDAALQKSGAVIGHTTLQTQ